LSSTKSYSVLFIVNEYDLEVVYTDQARNPSRIVPLVKIKFRKLRMRRIILLRGGLFVYTETKAVCRAFWAMFFAETTQTIQKQNRPGESVSESL